jgi:chromosome partitioning protein
MILVLTLVVAAQKGGSGKTTIALHLSVASSESQPTIVVDTDPQRSASGWARIRAGKPPEVFEATPASVPAILTAAREDGIGVVVIDTPPHSTADASRVLGMADLVVVPVRPTVLDLMALEATQRIVQAAGRPAVAVLSAVPARGPEADEAAQVLADMGFSVAPVRIKERRAYSRALATGHAVTEFPRSADARSEIVGLWNWLHDSMVSRHQDIMVAS